MSQHDYDFFATGRPVDQPAGAAPPPPAAAEWAAPPRVNQFGQATDPQGRPVNQFGTPVDAVAAPTGPSAAPGYGAIPVAAHGLAPAWEQPQASSMWGAPAGPTYGPPGMYSGPPGHGAGLSDDRPGPVLAAGIISIVCGGIVLASALVTGVLAMGVTNALGGSAGLGAILAVGVLLLFGLGALYLVLGIAMVKSRRWAVWTTLVLASVGLLYSLTQLVSGSGSSTTYNSGGQVTTTHGSSSLFTVLLSIGFLALLVVPPSWKWLNRKI